MFLEELRRVKKGRVKRHKMHIEQSQIIKQCILDVLLVELGMICIYIHLFSIHELHTWE